MIILSMGLRFFCQADMHLGLLASVSLWSWISFRSELGFARPMWLDDVLWLQSWLRVVGCDHV